MQNFFSAVHPLDHWSLREKVQLPLQSQSIEGMKIAYSFDLGFMQLEPDVKVEMQKALEVFASLGAQLEEVALPWDRSIEDAAMQWYGSMPYGREIVRVARETPKLLTPYALHFAKFAQAHVSLNGMANSWLKVQEMQAWFGPLMQNNDLFICPTNGVPAVSAVHNPTNPEFYVNGVKVDPENGWVMTHPFNMLHFTTVLAVPSGRASIGVSTGIQLIGRSFDDMSVFRAGLAYEAASPSVFIHADNHPL